MKMLENDEKTFDSFYDNWHQPSFGTFKSLSEVSRWEFFFLEDFWRIFKKLLSSPKIHESVPHLETPGSDSEVPKEVCFQFSLDIKVFWDSIWPYVQFLQTKKLIERKLYRYIHLVAVEK